MTIQIPLYVQSVLRQLAAAGHEAYVVGGCVRDSLLGRAPHDWDVCTSALPSETQRCFAGWRVIETGLRHGTLTVLSDRLPVEVTTYRIDGTYSDNRRPDTVRFTRSLREDLCRRDFTVGAMAYNPSDGLVDYFGGRADLAARTLRCVGDPRARFSEDALRVLRLLRFAAELDFAAEPATAAAAHACRLLLCNIAAERIAAETNRLLAGPAVERALRAHKDVLTAYLPELDSLPERAWNDTLAALSAAPADRAVRWACLLHRLPGADQTARAVLRRLKFDTATCERVSLLLRALPAPLPADRPAARRLVGALGSDALRQWLALHRAAAATDAAKTAAIETAAALLGQVQADGDCCTLSTLAVNGRDLAGLADGPALGALLRRLLDGVLDGRLPNERDALLKAAADWTAR